MSPVASEGTDGSNGLFCGGVYRPFGELDAAGLPRSVRMNVDDPQAEESKMRAAFFRGGAARYFDIASYWRI